MVDKALLYGLQNINARCEITRFSIRVDDDNFRHVWCRGCGVRTTLLIWRHDTTALPIYAKTALPLPYLAKRAFVMVTIKDDMLPYDYSRGWMKFHDMEGKNAMAINGQVSISVKN